MKKPKMKFYRSKDDDWLYVLFFSFFLWKAADGELAFCLVLFSFLKSLSPICRVIRPFPGRFLRVNNVSFGRERKQRERCSMALLSGQANRERQVAGERPPSNKFQHAMTTVESFARCRTSSLFLSLSCYRLPMDGSDTPKHFRRFPSVPCLIRFSFDEKGEMGSNAGHRHTAVRALQQNKQKQKKDTSNRLYSSSFDCFLHDISNILSSMWRRILMINNLFGHVFLAALLVGATKT